MAFEDSVITRLVLDNQQFMAALGQSATELRKFSKIGAGGNNAAGGLNRVAGQSQNLNRNLVVQNRTLSNTSNLMKDLSSQTGGFTTSFRRAALSIQTGTTWLDKFSIQADRASMTAWRFVMAGTSMQQLAAVTGTTAAGMALATKKMVDSFSMVDRIKRQFSSIYQSAEMGGQMVDQLVTDAVKIRYSVEQVLDAGRLLALEGFSPKKLIYDMADLAAGVNQEGITIVNATRAFVDATNGQFRRLKETFQITREDAMAFAPDAFQGPNNQISNQAKATDAIIRAIRAKYRGMNEATMQTIGGMLSNVDDAMTKSTAKMGKAIEGTVTGWLRSLMGFFDAMGKFADTGMGKAVAQTVLWGTAIMTAVTGLALLTAGMITLMGIFAAYKVFMDGRKGNLNQIINAELELMKISQELAVIEAQRSVGDLERLRAQLVLLRAIHAEEKARAEVVLLNNAGVGGAKLAGAEGAVRSAADATRIAQMGYDKTVLPMQIVQAEKELLTAMAEERSLQEQITALNGQETVADREQLGLAAQKTMEMERQVALLNEQLTAARVGVGGGVVAGGGSVGNPQRAAALQAEINALKRQELLYEGKLMDVSNMQVYADEVYLERLRERIALREAELAAARGTAAADAAGAVSGGGRFARGFGRGFGGSFDAMISPIVGMFGMILAPIRAVVSAIAGAGGFLSALGIAAGALTAVALIAAPIIATIAVLNYSKKVHEQFTNALKESVTSLKTWDSLIKRTPGNQTVVDQQASDIDALLKMKRGRMATNVYEQLMAQDGMTSKRAREIVGKVAEQSFKNQGMSDEEAARGREWYKTASDEELRGAAVRTNNDDLNMAIQAMTSDLDSMNAAVTKQGMLLDKNAKKWLEQQIASGGLTEETENQYREMLKMEHPAIAVSQLLSEQFKTAKDSIPELESAADAIAKGAIAGETEAETFADINANAALANLQLSEMEKAHAALAEIDKLHAAEREKDLRDKREQVRLLNEQAKLFWIIVGLQKTQDAQGVASAAGMGNTGAIFGADIASAEWAAAKGEKDPKKRMERIQSAFKAARGSREDSAKQSLDLFAPGPDASPQEKAAYDRYKAEIEAERMAGVEADYEKALKYASPEQQRVMQTQMDAERRLSDNAIAGFNKSASDTEINDFIAQVEADKRGAAVGGASDRELLQYDIDIARAKMDQAIAANDVAAQMAVQVDLAEKLKALQDNAVSAEEAKLGYMESLSKQGLISDSALTAEKQKLAQWYKYMAAQSQAGSAQQYQYLQKSLDVMGDDTESKWDKIVGKIIGAPANLLEEAGLSEAALMRRFADAANVFGGSGNVTADILSQNRQSMMIEVKWDLGAVDGRINQALPSAMNAFAQDFVRSLRSA